MCVCVCVLCVCVSIVIIICVFDCSALFRCMRYDVTYSVVIICSLSACSPQWRRDGQADRSPRIYHNRARFRASLAVPLHTARTGLAFTRATVTLLAPQTWKISYKIDCLAHHGSRALPCWDINMVIRRQLIARSRLPLHTLAYSPRLHFRAIAAPVTLTCDDVVTKYHAAAPPRRLATRR